MTELHPWTADEVACAAAVYRREVDKNGGVHLERGTIAATLRKVAAALGCSVARVERRFHAYGWTFQSNRIAAPGGARGSYPIKITIPNSVLAERDRRSAALEQRTQTQEFFGDPAPGYSALDARRR